MIQVAKVKGLERKTQRRTPDAGDDSVSVPTFADPAAHAIVGLQESPPRLHPSADVSRTAGRYIWQRMVGAGGSLPLLEPPTSPGGRQ
jgi:hypothetical protein